MPGRRAFALTRLFLYGSGLASAVATVTIIAFFTVGQPWGIYNDFSYGILTILMLPLLVILRPSLGPRGPRLNRFASAVGVVSLVGLSAASFLLTAQEIGLISLQSSGQVLALGPLALQAVFFLSFEIWLLMLGAALKSAGIANAMKMSLIAITTVGYPIWVVWLARQPTIWTQHAES